MTRHPQTALIAVLLVPVLGACVTSSYELPSPRSAVAAEGAITNTPVEIASLGVELEERAAARVQLGAMRILVEEFQEINSRRVLTGGSPGPEVDGARVQETLRTELMLSMGNRLNIIDPGLIRPASDGDDDAIEDAAARRAVSGATHVLVGTWARSGGAIDVTARLVDLRDGWIVATAQRRIHRFRAMGAAVLDRAPVPAASIAAMAEPSSAAPGTPRGVPSAMDVEPTFHEELLGDGADDSLRGIPAAESIQFEEGPAAARVRMGIIQVPGQPCPPR